MLVASMHRLSFITAALLATLLSSGPLEAGEPASAKLDKRCAKGIATACAELAERWAQAPELACAEGAAPACLALAQQQATGLGVDHPEQALWAYQQACFQGVHAACASVELARDMAAHPEQAFEPLTLVLSPAGLRIQGVEAALFSGLPRSGDEIFFACGHEPTCERREHFDWVGLERALTQIKARHPGRSHALLRFHDVRWEAVLEAGRRLAGDAPPGDPLFPHLALVEGAL
jgi:hypothetical protein